MATDNILSAERVAELREAAEADAHAHLYPVFESHEALRKRVGNLGALLRELFYHADGEIPEPLLSRMRMTLRTESSVDQAEPLLDMIARFTEGEAAGRDDGVKGGDA